jgi:DNA-binding NarL/FixJ family response regulator
MASPAKSAALQAAATSSNLVSISRAERRVLTLMLGGLSNGAIATTLNLSRRTVEGHVSVLLRKTGCHSRTQLVLWALGQG